MDLQGFKWAEFIISKSLAERAQKKNAGGEKLIGSVLEVGSLCYLENPNKSVVFTA